jgi:uncharacterized membrane protein YjgN (DUF898 family)
LFQPGLHGRHRFRDRLPDFLHPPGDCGPGFAGKTLTHQPVKIPAGVEIEQERQEKAVLGFVHGPAQPGQQVALHNFVKCRKNGLGPCGVAFFENFCGVVPEAARTQGRDTVLQDEKAAFEIEDVEHLKDELGETGVSGGVQDIEQLFSALGEGIVMERVEGDMRGQISELRPCARARVGAEHDGNRRGFKMEKGVDEFRARPDRDGGARGQKFGPEPFQGAGPEMGGNGFGVEESECGMEAGPLKHMERAIELVLMDVGGAVHPEQELDVQTGMIENHQFGLAEPGLRLERLFLGQQEILKHRVQIGVPCGIRLLQKPGRQGWKCARIEVQGLPGLDSQSAKGMEKGVHRVFGHHIRKVPERDSKMRAAFSSPQIYRNDTTDGSMKEWYYALNGAQNGPVDGTEIQRLRAAGILDDESLVWCNVLPEWTAFRLVPAEFFEDPAPGLNAPQGIPTGSDEASPAGPTPADRSERELAFEFKGSAGEYFRIWIVNVVLTLLTFGIYAAWAKVRTRRYFYANTLLGGKPFDFTGNPVAILKGNLIFGALFIAYNLLIQFYPVAAIGAFALMLAVFPWLIWKALRFRAHNTVHRNVRMRFHGTLGEAYKVYLWLAMLVPLTLGFILPYLGFRQKRYTLGQMAWGNSRAKMRGESGFFYLTFFKALGIQVLIFVLNIALWIGAFAGLKFAEKADGNPSPLILALVGLGSYLPMFAVVLYYQVRTSNYAINLTEWAGVGRIRSTVRARDLLWLYLSNAVAVLLSLGLLAPWAKVRIARYKASRTLLVVSGDPDQVAQEVAQEESALGDAGADAFDVEVAF